MQEIIKACDKVGAQYKIIDEKGNALEVISGVNRYLFIQASPPLNSTSAVTLSVDKDFTYKVFKDHLNMPRSKAYLDPFCNEDFRYQAEFDSHSEIVDDIEKEFAYPVIVKMNRGRQGNNVFLCKNKEDITNAVDNIFNRGSSNYDYVLLGQEYVDIKHEYRVIWYKGEVLFVYEKIADNKNESLSPFHNENSKAVNIEDVVLKDRIVGCLNKANLESIFEFLGIDVVIDQNDNMFILELNTKPGFYYFIRDNGDKKVVEMYEKIISEICHQNT